MGLRWQIADDVVRLHLVAGSDVSNLRLPRGLDLAAWSAASACSSCWALVVPLLVYPWWQASCGFVGAVLMTRW